VYTNLKGEVCADETDSAVDVEADAARRHDRVRVRHVERGHVANSEAVSDVAPSVMAERTTTNRENE
jgi:hypothetical protein